MAPTPSHNAVQALAPVSAPAPPHQRAGMHPILAAAIGLTNLNTPNSPNKSSPSPSNRSSADITATNLNPIEPNIMKHPPPYVGNPPVYNGKIVRSPHLNPNFGMPNEIANMTSIPPLEPRRMGAPPSLTRPPAANYNKSLPPYPYPSTLSAAAPYPPTLQKHLAWPSSIRPPAAYFDKGYAPLNQHIAAGPFSGAAVDRFSISDRVSAMDPSAAASAPNGLSFPHYAYHQPIPGSLPPLLPPHRNAPAPVTKNFPETLFDIISLEQHSYIITWLPHGKGFMILDKHRFANEILPRYFDGAKFTSFTRRLKRWNFVRVPRGPEMGAYYNKNFKKDHPELVKKMQYRVDGQFEENKKKSEEKEKKKTETEKQTENDKEVEGESKVPKEIKTPSPRLDAATASPRNLQGSPMLPLPSALPKRSKHAATNKKKKNSASPRSSSMPLGYPASGAAGHPEESSSPTGRLGYMEAQQEMLLARPRLSHRRTEHIGNSGIPANQELLSSKMLPHSNPHEDFVIGAPPHRLQSRLPAPNCRNMPLSMGYNGREAHMTSREINGRPVMMSQEEEKEFAQYLMMKRENNIMRLQAPVTWDK